MLRRAGFMICVADLLVGGWESVRMGDQFRGVGSASKSVRMGDQFRGEWRDGVGVLGKVIWEK